MNQKLSATAQLLSVKRRAWLQAGVTGILLPNTLWGCGGGSDSTTTADTPATADTSVPTAPVVTTVPETSGVSTVTSEPTQASILTTPSSRFASLSDFNYPENYISVEGKKMHYVDAGSRDAQHVFLCLHGQPTWSYLYRKMIPVFTKAGHRVIAPDWIGFGKSDKPRADSVFTFDFHRACMLAFIKQLDLRNVTLVVQDWGGLLGLTLPMVTPERFTRLIIMNTTFATGEPLDASQTNWNLLSQGRRERWQAVTDVDIQRIMLSASTTATSQVAAAYDAPFPDPSYEAGARRFPIIVPISPSEDGAAVSREAMAWWGTQWNGKTFMAIGMQDELLGPTVMNIMKTKIRNCPAPLQIANAGHFVQEDAGMQVAEAALSAFA